MECQMEKSLSKEEKENVTANKRVLPVPSIQSFKVLSEREIKVL